ncbi:hypothetical protein BA953_01145 [Vibrio coralliilyticus]|uniref:DUF952 domain-containing protein n=1 Tax=Vibrio coralliilyticus TaxID=190893 RepID=UPI000810D5B8|nr:DUF952 domain-containing protein [Vibrio coralliilyticus]ANW22917.1 hypothetical protein BA953_01145 [Vibrio coralliilyticus]
MKKLYHIIFKKDLEAILGAHEYKPSSLDEEGFIHLAYYEQIESIIGQFFMGATGVYLLEIEPSKLDFPVNDEAPAGIVDDGTLYPHLYGPLSLKAVSGVFGLSINANSQFKKTRLSEKLI